MQRNRAAHALRVESLESRQLLAANVLITEFLADNEIGLRDEAGDREDWVELFNAGDEPATLTGWFLTDDATDLRKWRLPRTTLDPGAYLVVYASNKDQYQSGSPLHTDFKLSADGEYLALVEPDGQTIASAFGPTYRAQLADISYGHPQVGGETDVETLRYFTAPTPGAPNGAGVTDVGPILTGVTHTPKEPAFDQPLHVTANVLAGAAGVKELNLTYRVGSGRGQRTVTLPMFDDGAHGDGAAGDGQYGGDIPAGVAPPSDIIRYNFTVIDNNDASTVWPRPVDTTDRALHYGTIVADPSVVSNLPVMYMFVTVPAGADTETGTRGAVYFNGVFYDNVLVDIHGQSTRSFPKKSYDVDFPRDQRFQPFLGSEHTVKDINLLSNYADKSKLRNTLAYETYADAGAATHFAFPIRLQRNGAFYGVYDLVEDGDDDFLERNGLDPSSALYKMYNSFQSTADAEKKTRLDEGTADLAAFQAGLRQSGAALTRFLYDNVDIPGMVNYLAAMTLTGNTDCCHKNYYAYRDTLGTGEWMYLPWDLDLTFGRNWTSSQHYFDDGLYSQNPLYIGRGNLLIDALFNDAAFNQMYLRRVRTLMDELLQTSDTPEAERHYENRIDQLIEQIGGDAALDNAKWGVWGTFPTWEQQLEVLRDQYLPQRRNYLFNMQSSGSGPIPGAQSAEARAVIEAVEVSPASGNRDEQYVQIRHPGRGTAIDISGWKIEGSIRYTFKPGTILSSGSSVYLAADTKSFRARTTGPGGNQGLFVQEGFEGSLPSSGGEFRLVDQHGREIATYSYAGESTLAQQFLRITELNYHPYTPPAGSLFEDNDYEFLEFANIGDQPIPLAGVEIFGGIQYNFSESPITELAPGQYVVIVANEVAFRERYGDGPLVAGMYDDHLSNSSESLWLRDADGSWVLNFHYDDGWYPDTDGDGPTLVIADATLAIEWWNIRPAWRESQQHGGSPGAPNNRLVGDANLDGVVGLDDLNLVRNHFGRSTPGPGDADFDGDVDLADLNAVRNFFGAVAAAPALLTTESRDEGFKAQRTPALASDAVFALYRESTPPSLLRPRQKRI